MKLFLDDRRACPAGWTLAQDSYEAISLAENNHIEAMSLDHDLGMHYCRACSFSSGEEPCFSGLGIKLCDCTCHTEKPNGLDFLKWVHANNKWPDERPIIHSGNIVGATNMRNYINDFGPYAR